MSSWQEHQSCFCQNKKKHNHLSRTPKREMGESQGERERTLMRKRESERDHGEKSVDLTVKKGSFQGREGGQAKSTSIEESTSE